MRSVDLPTAKLPAVKLPAAKLFDVTVALSSDLPVWPDDPPIVLERVQEIEKGDLARVTRACFSTHCGTHVDPPAHFLRDGATLDQLPLEVLIGVARVVETGAAAVIDVPELQRHDWQGVTRVLFKTRNAAFWPEARSFQRDYVALTTAGAAWLVARGIRLVGIDYLSIEQFEYDEPTTHLTLLRNNVVIVEGLDLRAVTAGDYELFCLPLKIKDGDGAPARVVLRELP